MGLFEELKESARQERLGDADNAFWRKLGYIFELRSPALTKTNGSMHFTLLLGPQRYSYREDFAADVVPTMGGIFTEEHGIILGHVSMDAHEGFVPRLTNDNIGPAAIAKETKLPAGPVVLSGHARFKRLREGIFRHYSDLKKDPNFSADTYMVLHVLKDDDHLLVVPERFELSRDSGKPTLHPFSIDLQVIGRAKTSAPKAPSEDKSLLDRYKVGVRKARSAVTKGQAAVREVSAVVGEANQIINQTQGILSDAGNVFSAVADVIDTTVDVLGSATVGTLRTLTDSMESVLRAFSAHTNFPADLVGLWADIEDQALSLKAFYDPADGGDNWFARALSESGRLLEHQQNRLRSESKTDLDAADAAGPVTTALELRTTALRAGDRARVEEGGLYPYNKRPPYVGWIEYIVQAGDSLQSIAANELGDAAAWEDIAIINDLRYPYIISTFLNNTVRVGGRLLLPTTDAGRATFTIGGAAKLTGESQQQAFFGIDLRLDKTEGIGIDQRSGGTDFDMLAGVDNMGQAVQIKLSTIRGENILYRNIGIDHQAGAPQTVENIMLGRFRVEQALLLDPRIESLSRVDFSADGDTILIDVDVALQNHQNLTTRQAVGS